MKSTVYYRNHNSIDSCYKQQGVVLLTSLMFLVIITIIAVSAMRSSTSELRISGIHEENMAARQVAQAAIDSVVENATNNFRVTGNRGNVVSGITATGLTEFTNTTVTVTELGIQNAKRGLGVSQDKFSMALFSINANYDDTSNRKGQENLSQGMLLLIPKAN